MSYKLNIALFKISEVLLDKVNHIRTVVNKVNEIDNTYRNFKFEILAGEKSSQVQCKENGCEFKFDFAHVYWNPRLGTEHERVVNLLNSDDIVYDVFAGVGPFSIPAATNKKIAACLSNDLNPHSYKYLLENYKNNNKSKTKLKDLETRKTLVKRSKIPDLVLTCEELKFDPNEFFMAFNLDGRDFIRTKFKYHLIELLNYRQANEFDFSRSKCYALMNLPAMSVEFLDSFTNLYKPDEIDRIKKALKPDLIENFQLHVFCYHFCKGDKTELVKIQERIRHEIYQQPELKIHSKYVRKVAPNKDMYCTMFQIGFKIFFTNGELNPKNKAVEDADVNREIKVQKIE
ncbi:tRNA (guanine(37)-N1)-methyltransferase [Brachionus plicatilis]|uniref:tRNA (Guanine(37)-N1)-methyltransferase n=1 Tax=Brachionus plicatilis TaxID=10195 RepID=A0A3M7T5X4_BRAPC|nr:tRNA (guanine(37)-N1)-methyltransferase [Brachionus plicatilis]